MPKKEWKPFPFLSHPAYAWFMATYQLFSIARWRVSGIAFRKENAVLAILFAGRFDHQRPGRTSR
jgi:hypothetical protein